MITKTIGGKEYKFNLGFFQREMAEKELGKTIYQWLKDLKFPGEQATEEEKQDFGCRLNASELVTIFWASLQQKDTKISREEAAGLMDEYGNFTENANLIWEIVFADKPKNAPKPENIPA